ncbi:MAG: PIN domain-containing protein [Armatimonadota bacterium]
MSIKIAFLDTMTLLHYQWIDQIDWPKVLGTEHVELVIAPVIFRELDKHKESHQKKRIKERAACATKKLLDLLRNGGTIRASVTIRFLRSEPSQEFQTDGLDFKWMDDRLLAHVLEYLAEQPGGDVVIVSHDSAVQAKALLRGIQVFDLPNELLLPVEPDESEKRIRELEQENRKLTDRIPKVDICFGNRMKHAEVRILSSSDMLQGEIDRQMHSAMQQFSKISSHSAMGILQPSLVRSHNSDMEQFHEEYRAYLNENLAFWHRIAPMDIIIRNSGNYPAHDVDIMLTMPDNVIAAYDVSSLPDLPDEPEPPRPRSMSDSLAMLASITPPEVYIVRAIRDLKNSSSQNVERPIIYKDGPIEVHYHVKRVKHNLDEPLGPLYLEFASVESASNFQIGCVITVGNVPSEIKAKLNVKIERVLSLPDRGDDQKE